MQDHHSQSHIPIMHPVASKDKDHLYQAFYDENAKIGTGKFGDVFDASLSYSQMIQGNVHLKKRTDLVVKKAIKGRLYYLANEIDILRKIPEHPNIVKLVGATENNEYCFLEKCLFSFARKTSDYSIFKKMPFEVQIAIFHNMITSHLHLMNHDVKNMDVHLMNWLVGYDGQIKMIDFGDAYNMFDIPIKHINRYKAKITTKDPIIQIDILLRRLSRRKVRYLLIALTRLVELSIRQSLLIYFINGGSEPEEYKEHFFKLHSRYTKRKEEKFLRIFDEVKEKHNNYKLIMVNRQIIRELKHILRADYIWKDRASPEMVREYFIKLKNQEEENPSE